MHQSYRIDTIIITNNVIILQILKKEGFTHHILNKVLKIILKWIVDDTVITVDD